MLMTQRLQGLDGKHTAWIWGAIFGVLMFWSDAILGSDAGGLGKAPNFGLLDHQGAFHELYYHAKDPQTKAVVLLVQGNGCPLVRKRVPEWTRLREAYAGKGIQFWMINANPQDSREEVAKEAAEFGFGTPVLLDTTQLVAEGLEIKRTAEAILIEADTWRILYRGMIADQLNYETAKPKAERHYLQDALEACLAGAPVTTARTESPGCRIHFEDEPGKRLSGKFYAETVAPILMNRCGQCHSQGGIGPWAMSSHRKVQGWSDMIEEVVLSQRMPPWQADRAHGVFANDFSLEVPEARQLLRWIRAGSPRGKGADPLEAHQPAHPDWVLGAPDHVIEIETQAVPGEGVLDYRYLYVDSPFDKDVWIRAVDVRPGNTRVLHHVIATIVTKNGDKEEERSLAGYAPGMGPDLFPPDTGILLPRSSRIKFQLHYTVSGKPETDASRLGLYFCAEPPAKKLRTGLVLHDKFKIPPGDRAFAVAKTNVIEQNIWLHSMNPHMHYRGKAMSYVAHYPDGRVETLLSVPHYHFNWQRSYKLNEPKFLPKGTRLAVQAVWDNSALNTYNPDPKREVGWGEQSFDEMFFASYQYTVDGENRKASQPRIQANAGE